jgi:hypothetical protein
VAASRRKAAAYWDDVRAQVAAARPDVLVLSSEYGLGLRPTSLARLVGHLAALSPETVLVGFLRSPPGFFASKLQQRLKYGARIVVPGSSLGYRNRYLKAHAVGASSVSIRAFARSDFLGGCIFRDFLVRHCGMDESESAAFPAQSDNVSLSGEGVQLMQLVNHLAGEATRRAGEPRRKALIDLVADCEATLPTTKLTLRPAWHDRLVELNREDVEWLRDVAALKFPDWDYDAPPRPSAPPPDPTWASDIFETDADRLASLIARVAARLPPGVRPSGGATTDGPAPAGSPDPSALLGSVAAFRSIRRDDIAALARSVMPPPESERAEGSIFPWRILRR